MHLLIPSATVLPNAFAHPIQILKTAEALARNDNIRVSIYCVSLARPAAEIFARYGIAPHPNLQLHGLIPHFLFRFFKLHPHLLPARHFLYRLALARLKRALRNAARHGDAVVYTRNENMLKLLSPQARVLGVPAFIELHWLKYVDRFRRYVIKRRERDGAPPPLGQCRDRLRRLHEEEICDLSVADGILCLTDGIRRRIERWQLPMPLITLPSGVDIDLFQPNPDPPQVDLIYCGSFQAWKGIGTLIDAMVHLPGITLEVVGAGEPADIERVKTGIENLSLGDRIMLTGHLPHAQVAARIRRARLCVLPSPRRGFVEARRFTSPLKLLEYAAAEKPIVASDLPNVRELFTHGENAWLVPPDNPAALAKGIHTVLNDHPLAKRLAAAARRVAEDCSYTRRAANIFEFIKKTKELK